MVHSLIHLMGFPMRFSRFLIVLVLAFGLAALPSTRADAVDELDLGDALEEVETMTGIADEASVGADLARWGGLVDALGHRADLDHEAAAQLLASVTDLVLAIANTGERTGVLTVPDIDELHDAVLSLVVSTDPRAEEAMAKAEYLAARADEATRHVLASEQRAMEALAESETPPASAPMEARASMEASPTVDAVEQWRSLVALYLAPDLVEEALSIIDCESNGDPAVRNGRSGAAGLFQFIRGTWAHASTQAGFPDASPLDPEANIAAAAWLVGYSLNRGNSAWSHWTCRP